MNDPASSTRMTSERSARYLDEVLLQPDQVDDVALTAPEPNSLVEQDVCVHPHGDY
jgi:hypothetical protein